MRDLWYGDKRDVVKWGTILFYARKHFIRSVLQVAFYRADRQNNQLTIDGTPQSLPTEIINHFHDIDQIKRLETTTELTIDIYKNPFQLLRPEFRTRKEFRKDYFNGVTKKIQEYHDSIIVLLDPDTGIAPDTDSYKLVAFHEIQIVLRAMRVGDLLLFYQHARLGDRNWLKSVTEEFRQAVGPGASFETITCKTIAHDVAFFMVKRNT